MALAPARIDWRWARVTDAARYPHRRALARLADADHVVRAAYDFKSALDAGMDVARWPEIAAAYELQTNQPFLRLFVEGMLLAGCADDVIADKAACAAVDVAAFHDLFFDVRPRIRQPGWVVGQLFQGNLYQAMSPRDKTGQLHRVAWLGGPEIFESFYTGRYDDTLRDQMTLRIRDMLSKQTLLAAGCVNGGGELNLELVRVFIDDTNKAVAAAASEGNPAAAAAYQAVLTKFMAGLPAPSIADPTDERNLTLPAREQRAWEYVAPQPAGEAHDAEAHVR